jgi:hypothetical protein
MYKATQIKYYLHENLLNAHFLFKRRAQQTVMMSESYIKNFKMIIIDKHFTFHVNKISERIHYFPSQNLSRDKSMNSEWPLSLLSMHILIASSIHCPFLIAVLITNCD